jgi:hypothetical protein
MSIEIIDNIVHNHSWVKYFVYFCIYIPSVAYWPPVTECHFPLGSTRETNNNTKDFRSRRWGSSLTICARSTVRSSPHRHKRKFSAARVCRVTFKHLPQPIQSQIRSFGTLGQLFKIPPFSAQKLHSAWGRGGLPNFFLVGILIFLLLRSPCKISKPYDNPFWEN